LRAAGFLRPAIFAVLRIGDARDVCVRAFAGFFFA